MSDTGFIAVEVHGVKGESYSGTLLTFYNLRGEYKGQRYKEEQSTILTAHTCKRYCKSAILMQHHFKGESTIQLQTL